MAVAHLSVGIGLLDLGFPPEAAQATAEVYAAHGRAIAEELYAVFKKLVWPAYKESGAPPQALQEVLERLKPLSVASLVTAYEVAMDEAKREGIARQDRRRVAPGRTRAPGAAWADACSRGTGVTWGPTS